MDARIPPGALRRETLTVGAGYDPHAHGGSVKPPAYMTSTFVYPTARHAKEAHEVYFGTRPARPDEAHAYIYSRLDHPNLTMLEARWAALDGAEDSVGFNSGMAAISAVMQCFVRPGDVILHSRPLYGGTDALVHTHLSQFGIASVAIADAIDPAAMRAAAAEAKGKGRVALVWIETPANPTSGIADIALARSIADEIGRDQGSTPLLIVDNTFLGPFVQSPLRQGADLCMTSLTKYAGGHSDLLGGGVSGAVTLIGRLKQLRTMLGSHLDPHTCWMLLRSLETMHLRTERAAANARRVAEFLRDHPKVASVVYLGFLAPDSPGGRVYARQCAGAGSTFSFKIRGGEAEAFRMLDRLGVIRMAVSLGGTETLICHSATTTHFQVPRERREQVGVDDSSLRISIGIEHADDLVADLAQALEAI